MTYALAAALVLGLCLAVCRLRLREQQRALDKAYARIREAQAQIEAMQKLAYLGTLTAGITHEIKNPLNFMNNFARLGQDVTADLRTLLSGNEEARAALDALAEYHDKILDHGSRAERVVTGMLMQAGQSSGERERTDLNQLVAQSVELARHGSSSGASTLKVDVTTDLDATLPHVMVAPRDVARAVLNLVGNAVHAASERAARDRNGFVPRVAVSTRCSATHALVRVRDNGYGIEPAVRERIFDPFFTTRRVGEGTGLGLSITRDIIVTQHKGRLEVDSQPGQYAEFVVELPLGEG